MEVEIVQGDCLPLLRQLPSKCVNWCLTSPPYNNGNSKSASSYTPSNVHSKYVGDEPYTKRTWLPTMLEIITELRRVCTDVIMFNVQAVVSNRENVYALIGALAPYLYDVVIQRKTNALPTSTPRATSNGYEFWLLILPDGVKKVKSNYVSTIYNYFETTVNSTNAYSAIHKAVMNPAACKRMLQTYARGVGIDPFAGTGTTANVAEELFNITGVTLIEKEPTYVALLKERFNADNRIQIQH